MITPLLLRKFSGYSFLFVALVFLPSCHYLEQFLPMEPKPEVPINKWVEKEPFSPIAGDEMSPISTAFGIGDKGYLFKRNLGSRDLQDIYAFDPEAITYTRVASVNAFFGDKVAYFIVHGKGYFLSEYNFWQFDPTTNEVQKKADFPGSKLSIFSRFGFSIRNRGYIGGGRSTDFWEYNANSDTWTQKADLPDGERMDALGLSVNNRGFLLLGSNYDTSVNHVDQTFYKTVWEYLPTTNNWVRKKDFPAAPRRTPASFTLKNKGFVGLGAANPGFYYPPIENNPDYFFKDFWAYDPLDDSWTKVAEFPGGRRYRPVGFSVLDKGYAGLGLGDVLLRDMWEYTP